MSDDKAQVKIGADIAELRTAINEATATVRAGMDKMNAEMRESVSSASAIGNGFSNMASMIKTAIAGIATTTLVKQTIDIADAYTQAESRLKLFTSSQSAQAQIEHELYEISQDTRSGFLGNLDLYARMAQAFKGQNVTQRETIEITETLNKAFAISGASTAARTAATVQLSQALASGVLRGDEFNSVMENGGRIVQMLTKHTGKSVGELRKMAEAGQLTAGVVRNALAESAKKVDGEFSKMQATVGEAGQALKNTLGSLVNDANKGEGATKGLATSIVDLSKTIDANRETILAVFKEVADAAREATQVVINLANSIRGMAAVARGDLDFSSFAKMGPESLKQWMDAQSVGVGKLQERLNDVRGKLSNLSPEKNGITDEYRTLLEEARMLEKAISNAKEAAKGGDNLVTPGNDVKTPARADESAPAKAKKSGSGAGGDTRYQQWKSELEEMHTAEQDFFKTSLADDEKYWQAKLATISGNGKHEQTLRRQIEHELYNIHKQQAQQQRQLDDEDIAAKRQRGVDEIEAAREALAIEQEMGEISGQQRITGLRTLLDKEYQLKRQALEDELKLNDLNAVAKAKLLHQLEELDRQHSLKLMKNDAELYAEKKATWGKLLDPVTSAINQSVQAMIMQTATLKKIMANMMQSITGAFAAAIAEQVKDWAKGELAKTALAKQGTIARTVLEKVGLLDVLKTQTTTDTAAAASTTARTATELPAVAKIAGGKAAGAVAQTPWVGPVLAAAAFAAMVAMIMNSRGHAVGSWSVPGDMVTKVHAGEMIVPEQFAKNVREGGALGGGGGAVNLHVHAADAASVRRLFRNNGAALAETLRRQARNFTPVKV